MKSNHFIVFYLLLSALIIVCLSSEVERILNYYHEGRIFSVEEHEENVKVVIKQIIHCKEGSPCIPPIIDVVSIKNEEDNHALKELFDELFKDSNKKERSVFDDQLSARQFRIISNIFQRNNILNILEYKIINNLNQYNKEYKERGYIFEEENDGVTYIISMGQKPSSGYSIDIKKVKIKGEIVTIYVNEKVPGREEMVDDVITYPIVQIKFNHLPSEVTILNYDSGDKFPCLI